MRLFCYNCYCWNCHSLAQYHWAFLLSFLEAADQLWIYEFYRPVNFNYKICCFINTSSSWKKILLVVIFYSFYGCQWSTRLTALFSSLHNFKYRLFNAVKYTFAFPLKKNTKKSCTYVNRLGIKKINAKIVLQS